MVSEPFWPIIDRAAQEDGTNAAVANQSVYETAIRATYDYIKNSIEKQSDVDTHRKGKKLPLKQMLAFSNPEQIWQQVELQNRFRIKDSKNRIGCSQNGYGTKGDVFFNEQDMERFVEEQEGAEVQNGLNRAGGEEIAEDDDEEEEEASVSEQEVSGELMYNDFFDEPSEPDTRDVGEDSVQQSTSKVAMSSNEKREERLKEQIKKFEQENLDEKSWQLRGEVTSSARPENSVLEEFLQFDQQTRLAPVITDDYTEKLEKLVIQRIKDKAWDDVERKTKMVQEPKAYKADIILDQTKSQSSLSKLYEEEFLKKQAAQLSTSSDPIKVKPEHEAIRSAMKTLFYKLDALSSHHYVPRVPEPQIDKVKHLPSVHMEEVAPATVSDAMMLAPEEIKDKCKAEPVGKRERTKAMKLMERKRSKQKMGQVLKKKQSSKAQQAQAIAETFMKKKSLKKQTVKSKKS